ncbi:CCA tRNA nucleotidyltransferase [Symbiobacterium terraclitae]|uniref:CCA tRNA nucleotidyltransferase n=1 Tax=Symbiobacterium terraclitae TaxID=557451 RepID=UPI0035B563F7
MTRPEPADGARSGLAAATRPFGTRALFWIRLGWAQLTLPGRLRRAMPPAGRALLAALAGAGHEAALVGGAVRDLLLAQAPKDWDLVTSAAPGEILRLFPDGRLIGAARATGTVLVARDGVVYEITPYRGEDLEADLARRDFTIDAMALTAAGRLIDPLGGRRDLAAGRLRACGRPEDRLREDPLRALRAVRLAAQFDLEIEPGLAAAIARAAPLLAGVAPERIGAEFARLLVTDRPAWGMQRLRELGLLAQFAPELLEMVGVEQNQYHAFPVWEHSLMALALVPPVLHLRLAALLHDVAKPRCLSVDEDGGRHFYRHELVGAEMADELLRRLRFDNETRSRAVHLVRFHMDLHLDGPATDAALRRMVRRIGLEHLDDLVQLRRADRLASGKREGDLGPETMALLDGIRRVLAADAALKVTDLAVDGHDVMAAFGRGPGPYVGQVLEALLEEVLERPERNRRDVLLRRLAELAAGGWQGRP